MKLTLVKTTAHSHPLQALVAFEQTVLDFPAWQFPLKKVGLKDRLIRLTYAHREFTGFLDRPLMHQLGSRLWPAASWDQVRLKWQRQSTRSLERALFKALCHSAIVIRYTKDGNENAIYGIVSPHFVASNQWEFRSQFLDRAARSGILSADPGPSSLIRDSIGKIVEVFQAQTRGQEVGLRIALAYGCNNGYSAHRAIIARYILVCTNGLHSWREGREQSWAHNRVQPLATFVEGIAAEAVRQCRCTDQLIEMRRNSPLGTDQAQDFIGRLNVAQVSKVRITERLRREIELSGPTEWSLSQALTWVGNHDYLDRRPARFLIRAGTGILDQSLQSYQTNTTEVGFDEPLLPAAHDFDFRTAFSPLEVTYE